MAARRCLHLLRTFLRCQPLTLLTLLVLVLLLVLAALFLGLLLRLLSVLGPQRALLVLLQVVPREQRVALARQQEPAEDLFAGRYALESRRTSRTRRVGWGAGGGSRGSSCGVVPQSIRWCVAPASWRGPLGQQVIGPCESSGHPSSCAIHSSVAPLVALTEYRGRSVVSAVTA